MGFFFQFKAMDWYGHSKWKLHVSVGVKILRCGGEKKSPVNVSLLIGLFYQWTIIKNFPQAVTKKTALLPFRVPNTPMCHHDFFNFPAFLNLFPVYKNTRNDTRCSSPFVHGCVDTFNIVEIISISLKP